jgi:hypothetical protein
MVETEQIQMESEAEHQTRICRLDQLIGLGFDYPADVAPTGDFEGFVDPWGAAGFGRPC